MGETFNAISFAGLAVALAVVIDDAVVGAENVATAAASASRGGERQVDRAGRGRRLARGAQPDGATRP